jgi:glycosyltransferase involved in cell wall biosynthesis
MRVCALIPAYNESRNIGGLVREVKKYIPDVLVVDDGSLDNTAVVAQQSGAEVMRNNVNKGKGSSIALGFALLLPRGFDALLLMDADGQHLPDDIPAFLERAGNSPAGLYIGNRMAKTAKMPLTRVVTNKFMSWIISLLCKQPVPDSQCGFRLLKTSLISKLKLTTNRFEAESEMIIQAARSGELIEAVPISSVYAQERSRINPFSDTLRFLRFILRSL